MDEKKRMPIPKDLLFALDIGTRNVVGTIARLNENEYEVIDYEIMPHPDRAMFDGQIHDIEKVTRVVKCVVDALEARNGFKLEKAAIAAAGRALKTERASVEREIDFTKEISKNITDTLEMEAIQAAQKQLTTTAKLHAEYYCVGYSVIHYYLDNSMILNPIGHKGSKLMVEIIATFLPHIVVDSLYAVINKAGLEVLNLTLEPIAAMNVTIPKNLRLLNLALVDVGAGTSDIAISRDGTVESYGMVAVAGDEITEKLAQLYLLDFGTAETLKISLSKAETHTFSDILGITYTKTTSEVMSEIESNVTEIAKHIASNIIELNKKPPSAVFCIGGGSQIPGFTEAMAEALSLPKERVAIKAVEQLEHVTFFTEPLKGPEFITPIGIGVTAFAEREQDFIQVSVNDNILRLFHTKELHVSDALIIAGISARSLLAERGDAIEVTLDGEAKLLRGEFGEPAKIFVNGMIASLDSKIGHKDQITIDPATKGLQSQKTLGRLVNYHGTVTFRGQEIKLVEYVNVNGVNRTEEYKVIDGDVIQIKGIKHVKILCQLFELDPRNVVFTVNGKRVPLATELKHGDSIDYEIMPSGEILTDEEEAHEVLMDSEVMPTFEQEAVVSDVSLPSYDVPNMEAESMPLNASNASDRMAAQPMAESILESSVASGTGIGLMVNGNPIYVKSPKSPMVFVDIFNHIDFDISEAKGILVLKLNGERARYTDLLNNGDEIEITWKK